MQFDFTKINDAARDEVFRDRGAGDHARIYPNDSLQQRPELNIEVVKVQIEQFREKIKEMEFAAESIQVQDTETMETASELLLTVKKIQIR